MGAILSLTIATLLLSALVLGMSNFYGNEVRVTVAREQVAGVVTTPPRTGASENTVLALAALSTLGYWIYRRTRKATARIV